MAYIPLGSRGPVTASADESGLNPGNLTCFFDAATIACKVPYYEIYSMSVTGLAVVATITVYVNLAVRSTAKLLGNSEWDPNQPILMRPDDQLALAWDFTSAAAPQATLWLRYDPQANQGLI